MICNQFTCMNMNNNGEKSSQKTPVWKIIGYTSVLTALMTVFVLWGVLQYFSAPTLLKYTGYANSFVLTDPEAFKDPFSLYTLGELVKEGTILSLDDLWSFQSSFYQTLITVLIAINGVLAAFAFIFIKGASRDQAIEAAVDHTQQYMSGNEFADRVNNNVQTLLDGIKADYDDTAGKLDVSLSMINETIHPAVEENKQDIQVLIRENQELRRHVGNLIQRLAELDNSEEQGADLELEKK